MAGDRYESTVTTSWFSRIKNAFVGVLFGLILIPGSIFLLIWNENNSHKTYESLKEGQKIVITVPSSTIDPNNDKKLVHMIGFANTQEKLVDPELNVSTIKPGIKLVRHVEMYQWTEKESSETSSSIGGSSTTKTTYDYSKNWSDHPIDSSNFKSAAGHQNPTHWDYSSQHWQANKVDLGAFQLSQQQVEMMNHYQSLGIDRSTLFANLKQKIKEQNSTYYISNNPQNPEVGDLKISYTVIWPEDISIVAKQLGNTFEPYHTKAGGDISLLKTGQYSADYLFQEAFKENEIFTWIMRVCGFLMMWLGLTLILSPLAVFADVIPLLGTIVGMGTGVVTFIVALGGSLIVISLAWFTVRPLIGGLLLVAGVGLIFLIKFLKNRKSSDIQEIKQ